MIILKLRGMSMKYEVKKRNKIRIVVIDSGIDIKDEFLRDSVIDEIGYNFDEIKGVDEEEHPIVENMHGTLIAKTIKHICSDIEFVSINILNEYLCADGRVLVKALKKAGDFNPHIVHLSLGTTKLKYWYALKIGVKALNKKNTIVVAAASNDEQTSYPAYFGNVVGVKGSDSQNIESFYYKNKFFYSHLTLPDKFLKDNSEYKRIKGNSISAAYITGHLSNCMLQLNVKDLKSILANFRAKGIENSEMYFE